MNFNDGERKLNVLSLFDGMSCGQIALERAGIKVDNYFASEIKPHAIKLTKHNYPNTIHLGDVTKWRGWDLPKIDLIIGGSPCQDFSRANKVRDGLEGEKSGLFYTFMDILNHYKPKYHLLENVIMGAGNVGIISEIMGSYPVRINSSLVSAQLRDRLYWTNIGETNLDLFGFPSCVISQPKDKKIMLKDVIESDSLLFAESDNILKRYGSHINIKENILRVKHNTIKGYVDVKDGECVDLGFISSTTRRGRDMVNKSNCLMRKNEYFFFKDNKLRYFTQTELEKLQTVPEGYTKILTRNQAACLLGDGWTVDIIVHILKQLKLELF